MTTIPMEAYKDAMREHVCTVCVCFAEDRASPGQCVHENSGQCMLFGHLGEVVNVVSTVKDDSIEPYVQALRQRICKECQNQDATGFCKVRDSHEPVPLWCNLDAYFDLVVGTVEDLHKSRPH